MNYQELIDYSKYPIDQDSDPARQIVVDQVKVDLARDGCTLLEGFLSEQGLQALLDEALERRHLAYFSDQKTTNAYLADTDDRLPQTHPVNTLLQRTNGFVTSDHFGDESISRQLYNWQPLRRFLADCLNKETLHIYADPVSNMIVNVCTPGTQFNWHFDTNEFTITMLLKSATSGGVFEYAPNIRTATDENYDEVSEVLANQSGRVKRLVLKPGDLQFFLGRYSLHQVTKNTGDDDRLLIIMSFTEQPGLIGSKQRVQQLYGKTNDVHEQQKVRSDGLRD